MNSIGCSAQSASRCQTSGWASRPEIRTAPTNAILQLLDDAGSGALPQRRATLGPIGFLDVPGWGSAAFAETAEVPDGRSALHLVEGSGSTGSPPAAMSGRLAPGRCIRTGRARSAMTAPSPASPSISNNGVNGRRRERRASAGTVLTACCSTTTGRLSGKTSPTQMAMSTTNRPLPRRQESRRPAPRWPHARRLPGAPLMLAEAVGPATEDLLSRAFADRALITAQAAARILGLDVKTLRRMTDQFGIRAVRRGRVVAQHRGRSSPLPDRGARRRMSVYKPAKSPYFHFDFVLKGRRFHGSTGVETRRAAEGIERARRIEAAEGRLDDAAPLSIDQAAGKWWAERGKRVSPAPRMWSGIASRSWSSLLGRRDADRRDHHGAAWRPRSRRGAPDLREVQGQGCLALQPVHQHGQPRHHRHDPALHPAGRAAGGAACRRSTGRPCACPSPSRRRSNLWTKSS